MANVDSVSLRVIQKVAERKGVDPVALDPPLYSAIDPEALDSLFQPAAQITGTKRTVEFQYLGYTIRVDGPGNVQVVGQAATSQPTPNMVQDALDD